MRYKINRAIRALIFTIFSLHVYDAQASVTVSLQPSTQTVSVGQNVVLGAVVTRTAGETITGYQWLMSTNNQSPFIVVGNASALSFNSIQLTNSGYYYVNVSYNTEPGQIPASSATSQIIVIPQPDFIIQPTNQSIPNGSNVVFSVMVAGTPPLHFQWQYNGTNLVDNGHVTGSSGTNLAIQNLTASDTGNYRIVVTNLYGLTNSQIATLQVFLVPPVITSSTNVIGKQGYAFNYNPTATGTAPITFGATGLPDGLNINSTNGAISGVPTVFGIFNIALFATNIAQTSSTNVTFTLANDIPVITSATNASGKQAVPFSYTITATNDPASFGAGPLPDGLSINTTNGVISGTPLDSGPFVITIGVTNIYGTNLVNLALNLASSAPFITSSLVKSGKQGQSLSYTIKSTNTVASFSAGPLPAGLSLNTTSGLISGVPLVSGSFAITIGTLNPYGSDSRTLTMTLASAIPVITSSLNTTGSEEQVGFDYKITANNSPLTFFASDLPVGLTVNTNTGDITGTPLYAGSYTISLFAANAWGVGTTNLLLTITNMVVTNLVIADVMTNYFSPYLLEFKFSLRDGTNATSHAVVASPNSMAVTAYEDNAAVSTLGTSVILKNLSAQSAKVLKGNLVLDFSESIASLFNGDANGNGISDSIDDEVASAQSFVNQQPADSQLGVYEFHRDDEAPQQVVPLTIDKNLLDSSIAGIWTNYVQNFPSGSRAWDALVAAIGNLGPANSDESHYIVFMSDGQDDSSFATLNNVITAATNANVQIYAVGFGSDVNTANLQNITSATLGRYYASTNLTDLALAFAQIGKDLSSEYILRWATLKRSTNSFIPSFQINYQGLTALSPANPPPFVSGTNFVTVTNNGTVSTNTVFLYTTNYIMPPYTPTTYASNVLAGSLRLVADSDLNPMGITLRTTYAPRYIRQLHLHYRANWPVSVSLESTNAGEMLEGWTLTQTNDGVGGQWVLLSSPNPALLTNSITFADFGNLLSFSFQDPIVASNAFSDFEVDNTIYTNTSSTNFYGFTLLNTNNFYTYYPLPPPNGTPIPWLISYGFTNQFAAAELLDPNGNGLAVWQDYLAGLNPLDTNSTFNVQLAPTSSPPQIVFPTVIGRTYRIDWATSLNGTWTVLLDGIQGTGSNVTYTDLRNLSGVTGMFYRVAVEIAP